MAGSLKAVPEELRGFAGLLERNANHFTEIDAWAESTASNTSGFTGLMTVLVPVVEGVTALYGETLDFARSALMKVKEELGNTSAEYEQREQRMVEMLRAIEADLDKMKV
ncbi:hypothetical protein A8924_7284 [Saccharopolyspora erythraea NRRL 2338]|nr:hypothetical protein [Saccharopolyspora erythraea]EQD84556.1 hypothetical protein N599_19545 [Saccharopolyspora erythraea D]PFG99730.1 hypothetical protein A8924_7284 [Saccharopolyspora erythraea NRRL 2338]QRK89610.1 hypothetical protein JQX30_34660 [Saccharopolyspora erythraea]